MSTTSHDATPSNCFSSVFRRLLCSGGLPTHPSTDTTDNQTTTHHLLKPNSSSSSSFKPQSPSPTRTTIPAGVVARLMGLDSFPSNPTSTRPTRVSLGSIMRSKSAGSVVDFLPNFDTVKHRRVRTSVSFREQVPTFLEASHNHDHGKLGNAKSEMGLAPKQEKFKNSKKGPRGEQEQDQERDKNKKKKKMTMMKNNEQVSSVKLKYRRKRVVVDDGFQEGKKYKSSKRTYNHPLPKMVKHDRKPKKQTILKRRSESEYSEEYCMKVLVNVFRLTMEEINGGVWMEKKVDNNLQEISYEVGQEILQLLVYEMVDELCSSQ